MTYAICHFGLIVMFIAAILWPFVACAAGASWKDDPIVTSRMGQIALSSVIIGILGLLAVHVLNLHATGQVHYELRHNNDGSTSWHWVETKPEK